MKHDSLFLTLVFLLLMPFVLFAQSDEEFIPDENSEIMTIQYRLHVVQHSENDPRNFSEDVMFPTETSCLGTGHNDYLRLIMDYAGDHLKKVAPPIYNGLDNPSEFETIADTRIRLEQIGCVNYVVDEFGYNDNLSDRNYQRLVAPNNDDFYEDGDEDKFEDALNIIFINYDNPSNDDRGGELKFYNGKHYIVMNSFRFLQNESACSWRIGETVIHEIGHALGLGHAFENGGNFENMYPATPEPFCDVSDLITDVDIENYHCTNNFMDYTNVQQHISPLQAGRMRNFLANQRSYYQEQPFTPNSPLIISNDTDWTTDKYINQDIRIKTGATLRITDCLSLGDNAAIYVEKGAKLVVDGGQISAKYSPTRDQDMWRAIFAEGNGYTEQSPETHACIELEDATLSYARNAIICSPDNISQSAGGALITANGTRFYNNQRDVSFLYFNHQNKSSFVGCDFTKDWRFSRKYGLPIQSITSNHNWGVTFKESNFSNTVDVSVAMHGVLALGSALNFIGCSFIEFNTAIEGIGSFADKRYELRDNFFDENSVGMHFTDVFDLNIIQNTFALDADPRYVPDAPFGDNNHGIILNRCENFTIRKENRFFISNSIDSDKTIPPAAILIQNCGEEQNTITNNVFSGITNGIIAYGENYNPANPTEGLLIQCNRFEQCENSIWVVSEEGGNIGIASEQLPNGESAGNIFIAGSGNDNIFRNDGNLSIAYNHGNEANEEPTISGSVSLLLVSSNGPCAPPGINDGIEAGIGDGSINDSGTTSIYPNPNGTGNLHVQNGTPFSIDLIEIYNSQGQLELQLSPFTGGAVDISKLPKGIYFIVIYLSDGSKENHKLYVNK